MTTPLPYICSRCLRASRQLPKANALSKRSYYGAPAIPSRTRGRLSTTTSNTPWQHSYRQSRYLSTTSILREHSLESQSSTPRTTPPPPPSSAPSKTPLAQQPKQQYTTTTLLNPHYDEESGTEMTIAITPRATKRLTQIMAKDSNPNLCLRVTVESGGCHGFQYLMSLVDMSKVDEGEDVLFVGSAPDAPVPAPDGEGGWKRIAEGRPKVVIDEASLELLKGSNVDYTMELIGSQFKIDNPRASSSCGCGTSFDVKI